MLKAVPFVPDTFSHAWAELAEVVLGRIERYDLCKTFCGWPWVTSTRRYDLCKTSYW